MGHLPGRRRQQRLLWRAARHRPGAQIRYEAPRAEDGRVPGLDRIDVHQPRQNFCHLLGESSGQCRGGGRTGLPGGQQQHGHAARDSDLKTSAGIGCELHRRDDEAVGLADKRALAPLLFATGDHVQHLEGRRDVIGVYPTAADMLRRAHYRGVAGIEVHLERIGDVARYDGALEEMDVLHDIDDAADVVQVRDQRFAVTHFRVDNIDRGTGRAEVHLLAPRLEIEARVLGVQHEMARGLGERVLNERPWK